MKGCRLGAVAVFQKRLASLLAFVRLSSSQRPKKVKVAAPPPSPSTTRSELSAFDKLALETLERDAEDSLKPGKEVVESVLDMYIAILQFQYNGNKKLNLCYPNLDHRLRSSTHQKKVARLLF